jgi:hypothetical protein
VDDDCKSERRRIVGKPQTEPKISLEPTGQFEASCCRRCPRWDTSPDRLDRGNDADDYSRDVLTNAIISRGRPQLAASPEMPGFADLGTRPHSIDETVQKIFSKC